MEETKIRQALDAYQKRQLDFDALVSAAAREVAEHPDHRQSVVTELTNAFQAGDISANDFTDAMKALADVRMSEGSTGAEDVPPDTSSTVMPEAETDTTVLVANTSSLPGGSRRRVLRPGDVLNDRFDLEEAVGEGGMGVVYRARDRLKEAAEDRDPYVALKVMSESFSAHPDSLIALQREARNAQRLSHTNIVRVNDFARDPEGDHYYIVMEYLRGEPLDHLVQRQQNVGMPFAEAWPIIRGVGNALGHAHEQGIVHSDVKPSNIWLTDRGNVKVLDFGIARAAEPDAHTQWQGLDAVTPGYASREMLLREDPDQRDDIYGLACVAYELLTGTHPFEKLDALEAQDKVMKPSRPPGLKGRQWKALQRGLHFDRSSRTPTAAAFLQGLDPSAKKRWPAVATVAGLVTAALAVALSGLLAPVETPEAAYLRRVLELPTTQTLSEDAVAGLLDEGSYYTDGGREEFLLGEYFGGNSQLKNGTSTAIRPLYSVVVGGVAGPERLAAAEGIVRVEQAYVAAVKRLMDKRLPEKALWLVCQALSTPPGLRLPVWYEHLPLYETVWLEVTGRPGVPPEVGCTPANVPNEWGRAVESS